MKSIIMSALGFVVFNFALLVIVGSPGCSKTDRPALSAELWCKEHGVPERFCTLCHPDLKSKLLMCSEHGLPEEICTICHPDVKEKYGQTIICCEHGLPKQFCAKCNPGLSGGEIKSDWCLLHGVPKSLCIRCDPNLAATVPMCEEHSLPLVLCTTCRPELAKNFVAHQHIPQCEAGNCPLVQADSPKSASLPLVRFADATIAEKAGITTTPVVLKDEAPTLEANGEVAFDDTRMARVRPRVSGIVRGVSVNVGDTVQSGQVLALVDSAELGQAKAEYLAAAPLADLWQRTLERNKGLSQSGVIAGKNAYEAEAELKRAQAELLKAGQKLRNFGFTSPQIAELATENEDRRNQMEIIAQIGGTIIGRNAVAGESVGAEAELFTIADLSAVWLHIDISEKDLRRVRVGQKLVFRVTGMPDAAFPGKVLWIDPSMNDQTRTIRLRAEVENKDRLLRANMFGRAEIEIGGARRTLVVPREAVQWEGASYVVFVQKTIDQYEPRRVLIGTSGGRQIELPWADVKPDELVVTKGSFLLKTEIQKGAIGAGCCGD
jgi:membrane fusion protein, heavy metal efflux system